MPLLPLFLAAEGEDTRATHEGAHRASVEQATVTTGQCAAAAQRAHCPTDTVTTQDSRSPTGSVDRWGTRVSACFVAEILFQINNTVKTGFAPHLVNIKWRFLTFKQSSHSEAKKKKKTKSLPFVVPESRPALLSVNCENAHCPQQP